MPSVFNDSFYLMLLTASCIAGWAAGHLICMQTGAHKPLLGPWQEEGEAVQSWKRRHGVLSWHVLVTPVGGRVYWSVWWPDGVRTTGWAVDVTTACEHADRAAARFWRLL